MKSSFGSWVGVRVSVPFRFMVLIVRGRTISVPPGACYRLYQDSSFPDPTGPTSSSPTAPDPVRPRPEQQIQNNRTSFLKPFMDLPRTFHGPSSNLSWTFLSPYVDLTRCGAERTIYSDADFLFCDVKGEGESSGGERERRG